MNQFHNTIELRGPELEQAEIKARSQSDIIMQYFRCYPDAWLTPLKGAKTMPELTQKEYVSKMVKVNFTQDELADLGGILADQHQSFEDLEGQKSAANSDFTSRIKAKRLAIAGTFRKIKDRFEMQRHDCLVEYDYNLNMVHYVFERNGNRTIVEQRSMTPNERQIALKFKMRLFAGTNLETFMA